LVVGAGLAGLCLARELTLRGWRVHLLQHAASIAASSVAAGLLQLAGGRISPPQLSLRRACLDYYPNFLQGLPGSPPLLSGGHLRLGGDAASRDSFAATLSGLGVPAQLLSAAQCAPLKDCPGAVWLDDRRVDPALLLSALSDSLISLGVAREEFAVTHLEPGRVLDGEGRERRADCIVLACGSGVEPLIRPGWSFRQEAGWGAIYQGRLALSCSLEEAGQTLVPLSERHWRVGSREPWSLEPPIRQRVDWEGVEVVRQRAVRLTPPDGLPLVGRWQEGLYLLGGLGRNGLLTAPWLAHGLARALTNGHTPDWLERLSPRRPGVGQRRPWSR
jgi:glycine/D-amino acid oxidase-like deaminating enzyme